MGLSSSKAPEAKQGIDPSKPNEATILIGEWLDNIGPLEFGQLSFDWDSDKHPRAVDGKFTDKLHHQIKEYLSDGGSRLLREIHEHTGHKTHDPLSPLDNPANAALKHLRDSGEITAHEPSYGEPRFSMTTEQIQKHKDAQFVSEKEHAISDKKPENEPTKQESLFDDIPAEHLDEARKLSALHGGREVRRTKSGGWQIRSPKGGKVSEVNGQHYPGGQFMPIHGLSEKPKQKPVKPQADNLYSPAKPSENGKRREQRQEMTLEQIEEMRSRKDAQSKWDSIRSTKLGEMLHLGERPHAIKHGFKTDEWAKYAESVPDEHLASIINKAKEIAADQALLAEGFPVDSKERQDYLENQEFYANDAGTYMTAKHQKLRPSSPKARFWIEEAIRAGESNRSHRGTEQSKPKDQAEIVDQLSKMLEPPKSEFSRAIEFCLNEFSRHEFSSTQFNIKDGSYSRSQGSPVDALKRLADSIPESELAEDGKEDPSTFHVTAKFGIHANDPKEIEDAVRGFGAVAIKLGRVSIFPGGEDKDYDVVKVGVSGKKLHELNALIRESTECTDTYPDYKPHLTIAYVKKGEGAKYVGNDSVDGMELTFTELVFSNKDREHVKIPLTDEKSEFSRALTKCLAEFAPLEWIEVRQPIEDTEPVEFARRRPDPSQNSFGWRDEEQETPTPQSSNVHSFAWEGPPATGNLVVRFNARDGKSPGPAYRYIGTPHHMYNDLAKASSKGRYVWDALRVRGTVSGHQFPYAIFDAGPTGYVPRQAGLKRGHTGEWYMPRTLNGVRSQLPEAPVRQGSGPIPGYNPNRMTLHGSQQTAPSTPNPTPTPQPIPSPAAPAAPKQSAATKAVSGVKSLYRRVLDAFKRKPKTSSPAQESPKQFSREEWSAVRVLLGT